MNRVLNIAVTFGVREKPLAFKRFFKKPIGCIGERLLHVNKKYRPRGRK